MNKFQVKANHCELLLFSCRHQTSESDGVSPLQHLTLDHLRLQLCWFAMAWGRWLRRNLLWRRRTGKNWNPESFLWFSAAARTRALSLEVSGDVARTEFTMSKDFVETLSRRVQRLKFQRFEAKDPIHILQIQMCARCGLVASAFKICAEARGSRWRLHTLGKPATGCKHTSKKVPVKKVVTWKDFWSFVRSIRMLRRSRGVSGMFLTKVG